LVQALIEALEPFVHTVGEVLDGGEDLLELSVDAAVDGFEAQIDSLPHRFDVLLVGPHVRLDPLDAARAFDA
jgi:hypothetical protein